MIEFLHNYRLVDFYIGFFCSAVLILGIFNFINKTSPAEFGTGISNARRQYAFMWLSCCVAQCATAVVIYVTNTYILGMAMLVVAFTGAEALRIHVFKRILLWHGARKFRALLKP